MLGEPFATFTESKLRERERELQFMTGDICGSGWQKKPGLSMCHLHTSPVPIEVNNTSASTADGPCRLLQQQQWTKWLLDAGFD